MRFAHILFLIIAIAVIEMYLLIAIGGEIGALSTIALVFITAAVGIWMLRQQGFATLARALRSVQSGREPVQEVAEAPFLLLGGVLLLLPGFFTDAIGFLCLLPWTRRAMLHFIVKNRILSRQNSVQRGAELSAGGQNAGANRVGGRAQRPRIIEGEWKQEDQ